jgi:hypothetical protein
MEGADSEWGRGGRGGGSKKALELRTFNELNEIRDAGRVSGIGEITIAS